MNLDALMQAPLPTVTIRVAGNDLTLVALPSTELDDMITRYPAPKDSERTFSDQLRFELVSRTVTNIEDLTPEGVKALFEVWGRADVTNLQGACFDLNWSGQEAVTAPLSETASDETGVTPSS